MSDLYGRVTSELAKGYDGAVEARLAGDKAEPDWKAKERQNFLELLRGEGRESLVEIGAGTGVSGSFFAGAGMSVVCTDLSQGMVDHCRSRGLEAYRQDVLGLDLGRSFDAAFAMNCLLHVPRPDLGAALAVVRGLLTPGGLFYLGQYGGVEQAGPDPDCDDEPKPYFSLLTDDDIVAETETVFELVSFHTVEVDWDQDGTHFQSLLLRIRTA